MPSDCLQLPTSNFLQVSPTVPGSSSVAPLLRGPLVLRCPWGFQLKPFSMSRIPSSECLQPLPFPQSYSHSHCCLLFTNPQFFIWDNFRPKDFKNSSKASVYEGLEIPCDSLYNLPSLAPTKKKGPDDAVQVFDFISTNISPAFHS